jgi:hypothetical protein
MTVLTPAPPSAAPPPAHRDMRRTWRVTAALCILAAPLLVTVLRVVMPYWTDGDQAEIVAGIAASPGRAAAVNWLALLAYPALLLLPLAVGFAIRRRAPLLGTAGAAVLFLAVSLGAIVGAQDVLIDALARDGGYTQAQITGISTVFVETPVGLTALVAFVVGHLVGMALLGVAVVRAGLVPLWVGAAIVVSQPVHVISAVVLPSRLLDVLAGWGLTTVGFALVALAVVRMTDDEWDPLPARDGA